MVGMTTHARLADATRRLIRTVDGLDDGDFAAPSLLPDWTRGHVVAHLVLNAEGLGRALEGVSRGESVSVYDSNERRDGDIAELAVAGPGLLRERLLAATTYFAEQAQVLTASELEQLVERIPGGQSWPAGTCLEKREREVEIHHADLGAEFTRAQWPAVFSAALVEGLLPRLAKAGPMTLEASDTGQRWTAAEGDAETGPTVTGSVADLGWWATGRGTGEGLSSSAGALPEIRSW